MADGTTIASGVADPGELITKFSVAPGPLNKKGEAALYSVLNLSVMITRFIRNQFKDSKKNTLSLERIEKQAALTARRLSKLKKKQAGQVRRRAANLMGGLAAMIVASRTGDGGTMPTPDENGRSSLEGRLSHLTAFFDLYASKADGERPSHVILEAFSALDAGETPALFKAGVRIGKETRSYSVNNLRYKLIMMYPYLLSSGVSKKEARDLYDENTYTAYASATRWRKSAGDKISRRARRVIERRLAKTFALSEARSAQFAKDYFISTAQAMNGLRASAS